MRAVRKVAIMLAVAKLRVFYVPSSVTRRADTMGVPLKKRSKLASISSPGVLVNWAGP